MSQELHNFGLNKSVIFNALINAHKKRGLKYNLNELAELSERQMVNLRKAITGVDYLRGKKK